MTNLLLFLILVAIVFGGGAVTGMLHVALWIIAGLGVLVGGFVALQAAGSLIGAVVGGAANGGAWIGTRVWRAARYAYIHPGEVVRVSVKGVIAGARMSIRAIIRGALVTALAATVGPLLYLRYAWRDTRSETGARQVGAAIAGHIFVMVFILAAYLAVWLRVYQALLLSR